MKVIAVWQPQCSLIHDSLNECNITTVQQQPRSIPTARWVVLGMNLRPMTTSYADDLVLLWVLGVTDKRLGRGKPTEVAFRRAMFAATCVSCRVPGQDFTLDGSHSQLERWFAQLARTTNGQKQYCSKTASPDSQWVTDSQQVRDTRGLKSTTLGA